VIRLAVPNPFFEGRNQVYVLTTHPITMVDTGVATQKSFDAIVQGLNDNGLGVRDIQRIILTNKHIEHIGCAGRFPRESGAEILIHESETPALSDVDPTGSHFESLVHERLARWQVPGRQIRDASSPSHWRWEIESVEATGLHDGQRLHQGDGELEIIHTPGHTMGSICIRHGRELFTGDHVLPTLSPNIGAGDIRHAGLLRHYLSSLQRIAELADDIDHALPGHGDPFDTLGPRCEELAEHHRQRLARVLEIVQGGDRSIYEIAIELFGEMKDFHIVLGCAEAHAHLEYLVDEKQLITEDDRHRLAK
jgi:glyoxylase-like metal-dependent hydrolase (beta-lactamase superfamily II)